MRVPFLRACDYRVRRAVRLGASAVVCVALMAAAYTRTIAHVFHLYFFQSNIKRWRFAAAGAML